MNPSGVVGVREVEPSLSCSLTEGMVLLISYFPHPSTCLQEQRMEDLPSPCTSITPKPDSLLNPLRLSGRNDLPAQISYRYDGQNNSFTLHNLARAPGVRRARRRRGRAALARTAARPGLRRGERGARCFGRC